MSSIEEAIRRELGAKVISTPEIAEAVSVIARVASLVIFGLTPDQNDRDRQTALAQARRIFDAYMDRFGPPDSDVVTAEGPVDAALESDAPFPAGALKILADRLRPGEEPWLVEVEPAGLSSERYGVYFIQFPERGERAGGYMCCRPREAFRDPETVEEIVLVHVYRTAKRVRELEAELKLARKDAEAIQLTRDILKRGE